MISLYYNDHYAIQKTAQTYYAITISICNKVKSSRGPKFDGDAKQTLEIRVKRKRNSRSEKLVKIEKLE